MPFSAGCRRTAERLLPAHAGIFLGEGHKMCVLWVYLLFGMKRWVFLLFWVLYFSYCRWRPAAALAVCNERLRISYIPLGGGRSAAPHPRFSPPGEGPYPIRGAAPPRGPASRRGLPCLWRSKARDRREESPARRHTRGNPPGADTCEGGAAAGEKLARPFSPPGRYGPRLPGSAAGRGGRLPARPGPQVTGRPPPGRRRALFGRQKRA